MRNLEKALTLFFLGGAIAVLLLLQLLPSGSGGPATSVFSVEDRGLRASYLLLEQLGFTPRSWTSSPGHLPRDESLLLMAAVPETPPNYEQTGEAGEPGEPGETGEATPVRSRRLRDPLHYLRFVEEGGRVLLPADEEELEFLTDTLSLAEFEDLRVIESPDIEAEIELEPLSLFLGNGERLELEWAPGHYFASLPVTTRFEVLAADEAGRARCVSLPVGRGAFALLAPGDPPFVNELLGEGDNALFLVRLVEALSPGGVVLYDEYALGGWVPDSPLDLALSAQSFPFTLHLVLWALVGLWFVAWARAFARDPEPLGQVSAALRARGFAGMLGAAGRWDLLARMLRAGVARRLAARLGLRRRASGEEGDRKLPGELDAGRLDALIDRLAAGEKAAERERLAGLLASAPVRDADGLERLANELAKVEERVHARVTAQVRTGA